MSTTYIVGQIPLKPYICAVRSKSSGGLVDLTEYTTKEIVYLSPSGDEVVLPTTMLTLGMLQQDWPAESIFDRCGHWKRIVRLTGPNTVLDYPVDDEDIYVKELWA